MIERFVSVAELVDFFLTFGLQWVQGKLFCFVKIMANGERIFFSCPIKCKVTYLSATVISLLDYFSCAICSSLNGNCC